MLPELARAKGQIDMGLLSILRCLSNGLAPWPLLLHGDPGTGKTLAALCLCDQISSSWYWQMNDLLELHGEIHGEDLKAAKRMVDHRMRARELIVVDEVGAKSTVKDLYKGCLKTILDTRELKQGRRGIYISNAGKTELGKLLGGRIMSRLTCGTVYKMTGPDRRGER